MVTQKGKNGGTLHSQELGDPAKPGAGRKRNPFKEFIQQMSEEESTPVQVTGFLVLAGVVTEQKVCVQIILPAAKAVVTKMFSRAAKKGDVAAARWLSETGFGKTLNLAGDEDRPLGGGFAIVLPSNNRD